jgi:hypothetical protein
MIFPEFMKSKSNHISSNEQNIEDIDGYFYESTYGSQMAFWTCYSNRVSKKHTHEFDEYMICVSGQYTALLKKFYSSFVLVLSKNI